MQDEITSNPKATSPADNDIQARWHSVVRRHAFLKGSDFFETVMELGRAADAAQRDF